VGADLLAKTVCQATHRLLIHRFRQQAGSHSFDVGLMIQADSINA